MSANQPVPVPPHLLKICQAMDAHLARYIGPLAGELCREAMLAWTTHHKKLGMAELRAYARLLEAYIPDPGQCRRFDAEIAAFLKKLG